MRTTRLGRMASLAGTGAKVGFNYLKHYGRKSLTGETDRRPLDEANADAVYKTFSQLKGGPLKLAQMLSIDKNLLPEAYASQFAKAQYSAPPLSYPLVVRTFQREFGKAPTELFDTFSRQAVRGASIGQVHRATKDGRSYAVKVQYPGVAESLRSDLGVVKPIALQILGLREADVREYFREVEERLLEETDYERELEQSIALSQASRGLAVRFPEYHRELSGRRVLAMDWVEGDPLDVYADSQPPEAERDRVGQALWDFYHFQIHELRQFHADPHPGNFLVQDGQLWVLDFGCTKEIPEAYYEKHFRFLDPALLDDQQLMTEALVDLGAILASDPPEERERMAALCRESVLLLGQPFREGHFDFGAPEYMEQIYAIGEANSKNRELRSLRGARGSADSVYINRAYFGLYSLLVRLRSHVTTELPDWLRPVRPAEVA
ncbi:MAG: AarF/UbiB family protein [Verrucomicrobiota bacterium]